VRHDRVQSPDVVGFPHIRDDHRLDVRAHDRFEVVFDEPAPVVGVAVHPDLDALAPIAQLRDDVGNDLPGGVFLGRGYRILQIEDDDVGAVVVRGLDPRLPVARDVQRRTGRFHTTRHEVTFL
jgi:hypothetical protein